MEIALEIRVGGVKENTHQSVPNIQTLKRKKFKAHKNRDYCILSQLKRLYRWPVLTSKNQGTSLKTSFLSWGSQNNAEGAGAHSTLWKPCRGPHPTQCSRRARSAEAPTWEECFTGEPPLGNPNPSALDCALAWDRYLIWPHVLDLLGPTLLFWAPNQSLQPPHMADPTWVSPRQIFPRMLNFEAQPRR